MRILLLASTYPRRPGDAVAPWAGDFAEQLAVAGAEVTVLTQETDETAVGTDRVRVLTFPWRRAPRRVVTLLTPSPGNAVRIASYFREGRRALDHLCEEWRPGACLAFWAVPMGLLARSASQRHGIPYAVWALGADIYVAGRNPLLRPFVRAALRSAALRFADGEALRREVEELSELPCTFLPTGRVLPPADPYRGDRPAVVFVGRFEPVKAPEVLLEAGGLLAERRVELELHLAGSGSLEESLRARVETLPLPVRFHDDAGADEVASLLRGAACMAIPSRAESIPVVFGEALQTGAPLVVSDVGDMGELGRSGAALVVPPDDAAALADAIERVLSGAWAAEPARREELTRAFDPRIAASDALEALMRVA